MAYDLRGRPVQITTSDGDSERAIEFEYHTEGHQTGFLAAITDPLERTTEFEYDAAGRVTRQIFPDKRSVDFDYDPEGNLTSLIPPGRTAHLFDYTASNNRERYEPPELPGIDSVTVYRYNLDRQLTEVDRPGGEAVLFGYDLAGRLDSVTSDAGTVGYSYHLETGQLTGITAPDGITLSYTWDGFLPLSESWSGAVVGSVSWGYDNNFWLTGETAADHAVTFGYDDDGLLTSAGPLSLARHPDHGLLTGTELADIAGTRSYNAFGELLERTVTVDDLPLYQASYDRDLLGRIETQELVINGIVDLWSYQYDDAGRLEQAERNGLTEHIYVYDDNGNRTQHTGPAGVVTVANYDEQDRLTQYGDIVYTHTEAGERLTRTDSSGTTSYTYDANTNLRSVSLPDGTQIEYLIDGRDRRVGKKIDGVVQKTWIYRDQLSPVAQFDGDGNLTHRFVYAEQGHSPSWMVKIDPVTKAETVYRFITDHLGSVRLVIDVAAGVVAQRIDYGPFGEVLFDSNPELQPFGFAGGIYDQHTGLVRFGARDYDPQAGRWTAKDPIDFGGRDANVYAYAAGNPINQIDPRGLEVQVSLGVAGTLFGGPNFVTGGGLSAGGSIGISTDGSLSGTQVFIQAKGAGMLGSGYYVGAGADVGFSRTDGPLPRGAGDVGGHLEAHGGWGSAAGGTLNWSGQAQGISGSIRPGVGYGVMGGVGTYVSYTSATPTFGEMWEYIREKFPRMFCR